MTESPTFEKIVNDFERAWSGGQVPSIRDFLQIGNQYDSHQRRSLLIELICVDLEFRWKLFAVRPATMRIVEEYLAQFPEIGSLHEVSLSLIEDEYRVRKQWGDCPPHEVYSTRFPGRTDIVDALNRVDRDLQSERSTMELVKERRHWSVGSTMAEQCAGKKEFLKYRDYLLHEMIGAGQMGRVYRATHAASGDQVAIKFLRKSFQRDRAATERFLREARTVFGLSHPGIVRVEGVGDTPGGGYFIVMEFLLGPDLSDRVAAGSVPIADAVKWATQAAEAVEFSNAAGIVHCDLKPGNLVLDENKQVRVTDFGLARSVNENLLSVSSDECNPATVPGGRVGQPPLKANPFPSFRIISKGVADVSTRRAVREKSTERANENLANGDASRRP